MRLAGAEKQIITGLAVAIVRNCDAKSTDFGHFSIMRSLFGSLCGQAISIASIAGSPR